MVSKGMTYEEFSRIYATAKDLVKATSFLHDMVDKVMETPDDLYVEIIMLHNRACDFIEAYQKYMNKEENKDGLHKNENRNR